MTRKYFWSIILSCGIVLAALLLTGQARLWGQGFGAGAVATASDSFVYRLELNGMPTEVYTQCSGLGSSSDIDEEKALNDGQVLVWRATPGALRWDSITLKRNFLNNSQTWTWRRSVEQGKLTEAFRPGSIVMIGSNSSQEYARWTFTNGWPARLSLSDGVEELVIVHDGLTLLSPGTTTAARKR
jgi:phage tail-like protein